MFMYPYLISAYLSLIQSRSSELFGIRLRLPVSLADYEILASEKYKIQK